MNFHYNQGPYLEFRVTEMESFLSPVSEHTDEEFASEEAKQAEDLKKANPLI